MPQPLDVLTSDSQEGKPAWIENTKQVYDQVLGAGDIKPYKGLLMRRFDEDTTMSQAQAWALMLIDEVEEVAISDCLTSTPKSGQSSSPSSFRSFSSLETVLKLL